MSLDNSPPKFGRIPQLRGFLPLNNEDASPMATHGLGTLTALIKNRSSSSLYTMHRRASSFRGRDTTDEEEIGGSNGGYRDEEFENFRHNEERRMSAMLNGPQMRSQRLIGNSNPRYRWERYWKTEEELKPLKKSLYVSPCLLQHDFCSSTVANIY